MFSESMLSMPAPRVEESVQTDYLPAFVAAGCAWMIAFLRGLLGIVRHEGANLDMVLTAVVLVSIPLIAFYIWQVEKRSAAAPERREPRRQRPRLVLISNH